MIIKAGVWTLKNGKQARLGFQIKSVWYGVVLFNEERIEQWTWDAEGASLDSVKRVKADAFDLDRMLDEEQELNRRIAMRDAQKRFLDIPIDWTVCPSWWNYVAIDKNGDCHAFQAKPTAVEHDDIAAWIRDGGTKQEKTYNYGPYPRWKESLVARQGPQIVPEQASDALPGWEHKQVSDALPGWEHMVKKDGKWVKSGKLFPTGMMTSTKCEGNCTCGEKKPEFTYVNLEACRPKEYLLNKWRKGKLISTGDTEWVVFDMFTKGDEEIAYIAISEKNNLHLIDNIRFILNCQVEVFHANEEEINSYRNHWFNGTRHVLYERGDANIPEQILDRNGDVVLSMCKICGRAESELDEQCIQYDDIELFYEDNMWGFVNYDGHHTAFHNAVCTPGFVTFLDDKYNPIEGFFTKEQGEVVLPKYARFRQKGM